MGRNTEGQLLNGAASTAEMPHRCEALLAQVDASSRAATALREAADRDQATGGQSGEGAAQEVEKHDGRVVDIACGRHFTVVLLAHGAVLVGGDNSCGQLGLGTTALGKPAKGSHEATQVHGICSGAAEACRVPRVLPAMQDKRVTAVACGACCTGGRSVTFASSSRSAIAAASGQR